MSATEIADRGAAKGHGPHGGALQQCQGDDHLGQMSSCIFINMYITVIGETSFFIFFFQLRL